MTHQIGAMAELAARQGGAITARQATHLGLSRSAVSRLLATGCWVRALHGVYVVEASLAARGWDDWPLETRVWATRLAHGEEVVFVTSTAAHLHGLPSVDRPSTVVHAALPPGAERRQQRGVMVHSLTLGPSDVTRVAMADGTLVPVTSYSRTVADLLRTLRRFDAVALLDLLGHGGDLSDSDRTEIPHHLRGRRGAVAARRALAETDAHAESPLETRLRLIAVDAGFRPDAVQLEVRDGRGVLLGRADLAWFRPGRRTLLAEADGRSWHEAPAALLHDRRRANALSSTGEYDTVRFTWADTLRPAYIAGVLAAHLHRRS